uniref:NADH-ubiquinone oxidoreductase chain 6 n=1 Tax=Groenewaldozyma salmanticensis TaxID=49332 RepID=E5L080_9ASCO|nr:NADH dehydrogenase subunit 6 [Groenewaldozyma salmanticensis]ADO51045.1 NADH dehydrogenase subunit 6 [Groenewaldozyma salmanticensis]
MNNILNILSNDYNNWIILIPILLLINLISLLLTKNIMLCIFNMLNIYVLISLYLYFINLSIIGLLYIMIYVGAITVLFVFIIALLNIEFIEKSNNILINNSLLILTIILSLYFIINILISSDIYNNLYDNINILTLNDNFDFQITTLYILNNIGYILYSKYSIIIIILGILLLFSIISCILILQVENESVNKRDIEIIKIH